MFLCGKVACIFFATSGKVFRREKQGGTMGKENRGLAASTLAICLLSLSASA
jgi:hypothetical protein